MSKTTTRREVPEGAVFVWCAGRGLPWRNGARHAAEPARINGEEIRQAPSVEESESKYQDAPVVILWRPE